MDPRLRWDDSGMYGADHADHHDQSFKGFVSSSGKYLNTESSGLGAACPRPQGVHWPQLSSSKKRIRLSATAFISSLSERITTACDPTKQPYFSRVPKSSGRSAIAAGRIPPEAPPGR